MARLIIDMNVETVSDLKHFLSVFPEDMPVYDSVGELLCVRVFEADGEKFIEVA